MKALWISVAATVALLLLWGAFINYTGEGTAKMTVGIDHAIASAETNQWKEAQDSIDSVSRQWYDHRLVYSLFFDAVSIGDVETSLVRAIAYCRSEEKGSAIAELESLRHLLLFLYENEMITIENIL